MIEETSATPVTEQVDAALARLKTGRPYAATVPVGVVSELIKGDVQFWGPLMAGALLGSIPVAATLGVLGFPQLLAVAFGAAKLAATIARETFTPVPMKLRLVSGAIMGIGLVLLVQNVRAVI
mgnify:CR=1 FL=1